MADPRTPVAGSCAVSQSRRSSDATNGVARLVAKYDLAVPWSAKTGHSREWSRSMTPLMPSSPPLGKSAYRAFSSPRWRCPVVARLRSRLRRFVLFLSILGPGLITASADNDAPGIATYSVAGSTFGYAFLWILVWLLWESGGTGDSLPYGSGDRQGLTDLIRERFWRQAHLRGYARSYRCPTWVRRQRSLLVWPRAPSCSA